MNHADLAIKEANEKENRPITVTYGGLCSHLMPSFEPQVWTPGGGVILAHCVACNKYWAFHPGIRKFTEISKLDYQSLQKT